MGTGYTRADVSNNIADGNIINSSDLDNEYDAIEAAFNSSTGHTHDGTSAEGGPITVLGPVQDFVASATEIKPKTTNTLDIGTSGLQFKDLYLDGTAYLDDVQAVGAVDITGDLDVDNININGNTISSTNTNGNITLAPNGTGVVALSSTDLTFGDNDKAIFGAGSDLQIYHNPASGSYIEDAGVGNLILKGTSVVIDDSSGDRMATFVDGGAVTLNHGSDASARLATTSGGIDVTGTITFDGGTTSADLNFGDNDKAIFGAGSDLQIYHDGSNSYVGENGTGSLILYGTQLSLTNGATDESYITCANNGGVRLYYDNAEKLLTTATGIDVTGTVTADGLDTTSITSASNVIVDIDNDNNTTGAVFDIKADSASRLVARFIENGDVSLYDSTGVTQGFYWDASTQRLGLGTTSPSVKNHTYESGSADAVTRVQAGTDNYAAQIQLYGNNVTGAAYNRIASFVNGDATPQWEITGPEASAEDQMLFHTGGSERMRINSSGITTVGGTSGSARLNAVAQNWPENALGIYSANISGQTNFAGIAFFNQDTDAAVGNVADIYTNPTGTLSLTSAANPAIQLKYGSAGISGGTAALTVDSSGNVGIGTTSPNVDLEVVDTFRVSRSGNSGTYFEIFGGSAANDPYLNVPSGFPMPFRIGGTEQMRITSGGSVGIGITSPTASRLHLYGAEAVAVVRNSSVTDGTNRTQISFQTNAGAEVGKIQSNTSSTTYATSSDYRLKEDVQPMVGASDRLMALKPVNFAWKVNGSRVDGFLAHEAQEVVPEAVTGEKDGKEMQAIDHSKMVPLLTAALQEALTKIEALEARLNAFES